MDYVFFAASLIGSALVSVILFRRLPVKLAVLVNFGMTFSLFSALQAFEIKINSLVDVADQKTVVSFDPIFIQRAADLIILSSVIAFIIFVTMTLQIRKKQKGK